MRKRLGLWVGAVAFSMLTGCAETAPLDSTPQDSSAGLKRASLPPRDVFIAMERDFQGFREWGHVQLPPLEAQGETHPEGPRTLYVNALPIEGARELPVGTQIVKDAVPEGDAKRHLFAMVKRGGGFNAGGARGWEWFELKEREDESVAILWRGLGAPDGESYGGDPLGTCNSCHEVAAKTDYLRTAVLRGALGAQEVERDR